MYYSQSYEETYRHLSARTPGPLPAGADPSAGHGAGYRASGADRESRRCRWLRGCPCVRRVGDHRGAPHGLRPLRPQHPRKQPPKIHMGPDSTTRSGPTCFCLIFDGPNPVVSKMHALRLNGAGSRLGSTVGSTRVAVCDDRRHRRLFSRVEHHLGTKRMSALRYLLVATSRSPRWWTSCGRVSTPLNSVFARVDPRRPASPGRTARIPPRLPGAAFAFERGTECNDRSVVAGRPHELGADGQTG